MAKSVIPKKQRGVLQTDDTGQGQIYDVSDGQSSGNVDSTIVQESSADEEFDSSGLVNLKTVSRYKIIRKLGQGSTAVVYLGEDPFIKRSVAIKISRPTSDSARRRIFIEAQSTGLLNHPNIVSVYDAGVHGDSCYITMEYIEGYTLKKFCRKNNLLPLKKVAEIIFSVCNALDYAHKNGVIHKDIKPGNIMIDKGGVTKITDFGIAQMAERTAEMGFWGTPSYMSPEQLEEDVVGKESDIFSLGCVLYELLTGRPAFPGKKVFSIMYKIINKEPASILSVRPNLPKILENIIKKALSKDVKDRYQTCRDFAYDLRVALRGLTGTVSKVKDVVDYVHSVPFFHNFTKAEVSKLLSVCDLVKVRKGKVIVEEGEIDDTFYIILSGKAKIAKDNRETASIGTGQCFGEMSFIGGQTRVHTVVADTVCVLMKISATLLDRLSKSIQLIFFKSFALTLVLRISGSTAKKDF